MDNNKRYCNSNDVCFVCDNVTNGNSVLLHHAHTTHSKIGLPIKLGQLIGDEFMVIVSVNDRLCFACIKLINLADRLENELNDVKKVITTHLKVKYQLSDNSYECDDIIDLDDGEGASDKTVVGVNEEVKNQMINHHHEEDVEVIEYNNRRRIDETFFKSEAKLSPTSSPIPKITFQPSNCNNFSSEIVEIKDLNEKVEDVDVEIIDENKRSVCVDSNIISNSKIKNNLNKKINHKQPVVVKNILKCSMCDNEFQTPVLLRKHIMNSHLMKWSCYFCNGVTFNDEIDYEKHMKTHIKLDVYSEKSAVNTAEIIPNDNHINSPINQCDNQLFKRVNNDSNEIKAFFKCKNCKFRTKYSILLEQHVATCKSTSNDLNFKCPQCSSVFKNKKQLLSHNCVHDERKCEKSFKYKCGVCSSMFTVKSDLIKHLRFHKSPDDNSSDYRLSSPKNLSRNDSTSNVVCTEIIREDNAPEITKSNEESLSCDNCLLTFDKQLTYLQHVNEAHKINNSDNYDNSTEIYFDNVKQFMNLSSETDTSLYPIQKNEKNVMECTVLSAYNDDDDENKDDLRKITNFNLSNDFINDNNHLRNQNLNLKKEDFKFDDNSSVAKSDDVKNFDVGDNIIVFDDIDDDNDDNKGNCNVKSQIIINDDNNIDMYISSSIDELKCIEKCDIGGDLDLINNTGDNNTILCNICNKFIARNDENTHYDSHKTLYCNYCSFETKSKLLMKKHIKEHNIKNNVRKNKTGYLCQYCSETFRTKKLLRNHEELHPENFEFQCSECDKKFMKEKQLKKHYELSHRDLHCYYCGKEILNIKALKNHEQRHIRDSQNSNKLECDICKRVFKTRTGLRHHVAVHTGKFKYTCEFCQRGFMSKMMLEEHRSCHTKEDRYVCDVCGRKFTFQSTYWIHRKWHDNPFPYKCNYCGRLFRHTSLLAVHKRKHTGERPYKCPHCPLSFTVGGTLKRHVILHTQKFPFWCTTCKRGFTTKHKYSVHLARTHDNYELLNVRKTIESNNDYKMVVKDKHVTSSTNRGEFATNNDCVNVNCNSQEQSDTNFEFIQDTNFPLVNIEVEEHHHDNEEEEEEEEEDNDDDDASNSTVMMPCIMTTVNNEENSGLVFEIIPGSPLQQITNNITLPENNIIPDMWCQ